MATPNRWAVRESAICHFYSLTTGKPIVSLATLKTSGVETSGDTVYAMGGRGNSKIVGFSSNRAARLNLEDAIFDNEALAMLTGNAITTGAQDVLINKEEVTITSNAGTLGFTPKTAGALKGLYEKNADGTLGTEITYSATPATGEYSVSGKNISFYASDYADNTVVYAYYEVTTDATAKLIKVTSDAFGGSFKVVLDCLIRDEFTKEDYAGQIIVPNAKFEDNFSFDFAAEGDPAVLTLPLEVLKSPTSTDMWQLIIFDEALIT
jgi:hypothetical protein